MKNNEQNGNQRLLGNYILKAPVETLLHTTNENSDLETIKRAYEVKKQLKIKYLYP